MRLNLKLSPAQSSLGEPRLYAYSVANEPPAPIQCRGGFFLGTETIMMDERSSRIFIGMSLLVLVWIGVYWMWEPTRNPIITIDQSKPTANLRPVEQTNNAPPISIIDQTNITTPDPEPEQNSVSQQPKLLPPEFFEHVVSDKQTMQSIAEQYFGSGDKWSIIARANPFVDPQKLKTGMTIRIPKDPDNIQGRVVGRDTPDGVIESHSNDPAGVIEYVVRSGDSLSRISQRIYGSARHTTFIFENNRDVLKSIDDISIGQLLRLPPLPESDSDTP